MNMLTGVQRKWQQLGSNSRCNTAAGEVYRGKQSRMVADIEACKKSCEGDAGCKSITFYSSGWCSHFSTECTKTTTDSNAISIRLSRAATTASPATTAGAFS